MPIVSFRLKLLENDNQNCSNEMARELNVKVKEDRNGKNNFCPVCTLLCEHMYAESC